ncbi:hypothetical protein [Natrinema sp. DC36]|uniref:hypothetical protein n=1 Tax=Natrinema sp. DC36 TaxID=2878680 RepID=UPI001CEFB59A|nr:hypothetical protein [Natrinema sp. DC36]
MSSSKLSLDGTDQYITERKELAASWKCPHCSHLEDTEQDIRQHITTEDDSNHKGRNGYNMTSTVIALDEDGEEISEYRPNGETPSDDTEEGEFRTISLENASQLTTKQEKILQVYFSSPSTSYAEINRACERKEVDTKYHTVRNIIIDYVEEGDVSPVPVVESKSKSVEKLKEETEEAEDRIEEEEPVNESVPVEDVEDLHEKVELIKEFSDGEKSEVAGRVGEMIEDLL